MLRPDSSDAMRGLAALALDRQDYAEAYDLHRRLIRLGEHGPELSTTPASSARNAAGPRKPRSSTSRRWARTRSSPKPCLNLGHALMASGQEEEARSCWRRAIREKPELAEAYFEPPVAPRGADRLAFGRLRWQRPPNRWPALTLQPRDILSVGLHPYSKEITA